MTNTPHKKEIKKTFSDAVNAHLYKEEMTQADLIERGDFSRTTVGRICRNKNDKGGSYNPTRKMVMHVCVALGLNKAERDELFKIAFPEEKVWDEISDLGLDIEAANKLLVERGFKPFTESE